jgi:two-component system chemotaxis response regulator CheY
MPKMNGLELLKTIRARDAKTPVMLITTERERGQVMDAITAGVTDYLTKPFTPDSLGEKLKKYLPAAS